MTDARIVTVTFSARSADAFRVHLDGMAHGRGQVATGGGWEYMGEEPRRLTRHETFWDIIVTLRSADPIGFRRPGFELDLRDGTPMPDGERQAAVAALNLRLARNLQRLGALEARTALTAYLAGWLDSMELGRGVERAEVAEGMKQ